MKSTICLQLENQEPKKFESELIRIEETTIKIDDAVLKEGIHLLNITHSKLNTLLDFSNSNDYQILYFDEEKKLIGVSCAINKKEGDFLLQTQAKWLLLIPFIKLLNDDLLKLIQRFSLSNQ